MTFVDHRSKTILIHIPKTGGGSIKRALEGKTYKWVTGSSEIGSHSTKKDIIEKHPEWSEYTFCAFVRNEDDWRKSIWRYWFRNMSYERWLKTESVWPSEKRNPIKYTLSEPLQTVKQQEWFDEHTVLFDFDNFEEEYKRLCELVNQSPRRLPKVHQSRKNK